MRIAFQRGWQFGFISILGFLWLAGTGWAGAEEPAAANVGNSGLAAANISAEVPVKPIRLQDIDIIQKPSGAEFLQGTICNDSMEYLNYLAIRVAYLDAEGNTLATEKKRLLDKNPLNWMQSLRAGYSRDFEVGLCRTPKIYQHAIVSIAKADTGKKEAAGIPLEPKFGFGAGWQYGGIGFNAEIMLFNMLAVSGGLGSLDVLENIGDMNHSSWTFDSYKTPGWQLGARYYFGDPASPVRGRLGLFYGTTHLITGYSSKDKDAILGIHPSIGLQWRVFPNVSLDVDAGYVFPSETGRDYTYTYSNYYWDYYYGYYYNYQRTYHVNIPSYATGGIGITYHFGEHRKTFPDKKERQYIHTQ